ncbi:translation initiation factor IF-2 subunit gamma [Candidatus Woesearchaeota archaeon]|nr:translation initiation factor IF-2 subunit gamma [Candidatus Woesearchaeota archaeon]
MAKKSGVMQPSLNLGIVGHVDHGKTTLTQALSGKWTDTHSEEIRKGITIRLGYADFTIYRCACKDIALTVDETCAKCGKKGVPVRKISIVDAPGHESLMATMLSGAAIMDGALMLIAANEVCPQPQTREHLVALQIIGIKNLIVVQNKIDLVSDKAARDNYKQIKSFLKGTPYASAPVIPVSAQRKVNIDALLEAIEENMPSHERLEGDPLLLIARSFDVNRPGTEYGKLVGGVLGGSLVRGSLNVDDEIEIRPGRPVQKHGKVSREKVTTNIAALRAGNENVSEVFPGGSVGVMTSLDPGIVKSDAFIGNVAGRPGKLPPVWEEFTLEVNLLERVVGARDELVVEPIKSNENLMLNVNSAATVGIVTSLKKKLLKCSLRIPVCAEPDSRVTISRLLGSRWRLIGYGIIKS